MNVRLRLALAIPTGVPITLPLVADKTTSNLSELSQKEIYLLSFSLINSLSLISAVK